MTDRIIWTPSLESEHLPTSPLNAVFLKNLMSAILSDKMKQCTIEEQHSKLINSADLAAEIKRLHGAKPILRCRRPLKPNDNQENSRKWARTVPLNILSEIYLCFDRIQNAVDCHPDYIKYGCSVLRQSTDITASDASHSFFHPVQELPKRGLPGTNLLRPERGSARQPSIRETRKSCG